MVSFKIRTYGKSELAMLYNPFVSASAARHKLASWIKHYPGLTEALQAAGCTNDGSWTYTPAQVKLIVDALGEP